MRTPAQFYLVLFLISLLGVLGYQRLLKPRQFHAVPPAAQPHSDSAAKFESLNR